MIQFKELRARLEFMTNKEPLIEMANLGNKQTNISSGYIWISTRCDAHGCQIKYFLNLNEQSKMLSVTIPALLIVDDTFGINISNNQRKEIVQFAKIFSKELDEFWKEGNKWDDDKVTAFKRLLKLTDKQIKDSKTIQLK